MSKQIELQTNSETTGQDDQERKPQSSTGLQHGETGSVETRNPDQKISRAEILRMRASLQALLSQRPNTSEQLEQVKTLMISLSRPSPPSWVQGRVATTLSLYYIGAMPAEVNAMISEDYVRELADYPAWAVFEACRWWTSRENVDRKRKPLPGDLSERAHFETTLIRLAEDRISPAKRPARDDWSDGAIKQEGTAEERREKVAAIIARAKS